MVDADHFSINEAQFTTCKAPITKSNVVEELGEKYGLWKIPDSFFGQNCLKIETPLFLLNISTEGALPSMKYSYLPTKFVNPVHATRSFEQVPFFFENDIKVKTSELWTGLKTTHNEEVIKEQQLDQDWTHLTHYRGQITLKENVKTSVVHEDIDIPRHRLTFENKILNFQDIYLFEDDLGDFGYSCFRVKLRVQQDSAFILMRSYVRIDGTLIRSIENRFFIDLDMSANYTMTREISFLEGTYEQIKDAGFTFEYGFNNDPDQADLVSQYLKVVHRHTDQIKFHFEHI